MTTDPTPRLRADARRNRDRIINTARTVFTERGTEVPMEEIAREAGVGVGTLYRRFPDRDSLIREVAVESFERLIADIREITEHQSDAWQTITELLDRATDLRTVARLTVLSPRAREILAADPTFDTAHNEFMRTLDGLIKRAQADGTMRSDVSTGDLGVIIAMLLQGVQVLPDPVRDMMPGRYIGLLLDGLRAGSTSELPGRAVRAEEVIFRHPEPEE
ncbi:TetR/AcrR family transcriptional regulator [Saccharopolyspora griseoalba]|uniref:TetR/AcrR family transcriptional regulator n=1 Tax=Saccharopolyspora griseoalba TaxID=1431848 RepID=A0ABW2LFI1_9PSEU